MRYLIEPENTLSFDKLLIARSLRAVQQFTNAAQNPAAAQYAGFRSKAIKDSVTSNRKLHQYGPSPHSKECLSQARLHALEITLDMLLGKGSGLEYFSLGAMLWVSGFAVDGGSIKSS